MQYCIYLRKSRADIEAEAHGEGETLARHEHALIELAQRQNLNVTQIYREIVSGETISTRPVIQHLLKEVECGIWDGVLVMEVERLARGDTSDQGTISKTFKYSETKIITPSKTYDPLNEFDEEYFEFGLFMSRREYKTINRRLQAGRLASIKEGKYVGNTAPFGYTRYKLENQKGYSLKPNSDSDTVKLIFDLFTHGKKNADGTFTRLGVSLIVRYLNDLHIKPQKNSDWTPSSVRGILENPVYIGKIVWNRRKTVKKMVDGERKISRPRSNPDIYDGLHEPIIDNETWELTKKLLVQNKMAPVPSKKVIANPLSGLIKCGKCGRTMIRRPYGAKYPDTLMCPSTACTTVSTQLSVVEKRVLIALEKWVNDFKLEWESKVKGENNNLQIKEKRKAVTKLESELNALNTQMNSLYTFLERGIYTTEVFLERSRVINESINSVKNAYELLKSELEQDLQANEHTHNLIPNIENVISLYRVAETPAEKNALLKSILSKVVYTKETSGRWHSSPEDFELHVFPKID
ncbi:Recombinase [Cellulosilyticum lentocellum DSM 5427]|uniref:Recombinase n=1 Tax=Cellulosilyticum lentocellum (strain ATCC 49066 / DSM 5427 / NCIMB 11756 / RHM5) TaxID=642492 RepID=F2JKW1_CELLD|nr:MULTISPECIES: recombinase family protein [Cellulosilyticum]ADZ84502.1 Recombinase [Cellulosilyticum lentocellum DSM 5427]QEH69952.1 recombinase family protein [Cellulosilyticum sp. WCF-2]